MYKYPFSLTCNPCRFLNISIVSYEIYKSVCALCPFKNYIRPLFFMKGKKTPVYPAALIFEYTRNYVTSGFFKLKDPIPSYVSACIFCANNYFPYSGIDNKISTREGFPKCEQGSRLTYRTELLTTLLATEPIAMTFACGPPP